MTTENTLPAVGQPAPTFTVAGTLDAATALAIATPLVGGTLIAVLVGIAARRPVRQAAGSAPAADR